jgi:hypothetical protein
VPSRLFLKYAELGQGQIILKRRLGNNVFDDDGPYVGSFWQVPETRPYMRVLQATVKIGFLGANYDAAAVIFSPIWPSWPKLILT